MLSSPGWLAARPRPRDVASLLSSASPRSMTPTCSGPFLTCAPHLSTDIEDAHAGAERAGLPTYIDAGTGYAVFTSETLLGRGSCCGNACRHCPFGHVNCKSRKNRVTRPLLLRLTPPVVPGAKRQPAGALDPPITSCDLVLLHESHGDSKPTAARPGHRLVMVAAFDVESGRLWPESSLPGLGIATLGDAMDVAVSRGCPLLAVPLTPGGAGDESDDGEGRRRAVEAGVETAAARAGVAIERRVKF